MSAASKYPTARSLARAVAHPSRTVRRKRPPPQLVTAPKNRSMAVLLAMLLGGIGIHRFYLNEPGWGVVYLLFCWTFIPAIAGLIEGLVFLFMSDTDFHIAGRGDDGFVHDGNEMPTMQA